MNWGWGNGKIWMPEGEYASNFSENYNSWLTMEGMITLIIVLGGTFLFYLIYLIIWPKDLDFQIMVNIMGFLLIEAFLLVIICLPIIFTIGTYSAPSHSQLLEIQNKLNGLANINDMNWDNVKDIQWWEKVWHQIDTKKINDLQFRTQLAEFQSWCQIVFEIN